MAMSCVRLGSWWLSAVLYCSAPSSAYAHGDVHEQIEAVNKRLSRDPNNAALYHKRGELERAHGDRRAALRDYARAEALDSELHVVHLSRGRVLLESGDAKAAVASLSTFLDLHPRHAGALLLRARALTKLELHDAAERDFDAAVGLTEDPTPDLFLERAANLTHGGRREQALITLEAALSRVGAIVTLSQGALELEIALGRYDAALARLDVMLSTAPRPERLLAQKADVLDRAGGRNDEARTAREQALAAIARLPEQKRSLMPVRTLESELRAAMLPTPP